MNNDKTTHTSKAGWQILGELELPVDASVDDALFTWLIEILPPLNLQKAALNKVIASAQDAAARAIRAEAAVNFKHIHITVFVPSDRDVKEQAWGFFRLEKIEDVKGEQADGDHAVEFYLYGEGD